MTQTAAERARELAVEVSQHVAELPDRDSPEDWPEAMLVTHAELQDIVTQYATAEILAAEKRGMERVLAALNMKERSDSKHACDNLGGAIIDMERHPYRQDGATGYFCDHVCMSTLKRVERQLALASTLTAADTEGKG